jgi:RsiW-degrading membrane proteinase PrsW (M82 family)
VTRAGALAWFIALAPAAVVVERVDTPGAVVLGATVPALAYLALVATIAARARVPVRAPDATFALVWGAGVAAPVAGHVNDAIQAGVHAGGWFAAVAAPVIEEAAKAAVVVALITVRGTSTRSVRAGIVIGCAVGIGFGWAENLDYLLLARIQEGVAGLVHAIAIRGFLQGAVHPLFAAMSGAGVALARSSVREGRLRPALFGFAGAVAQHAWWNGAASRAVSAILCNGTTAAGGCRGNADAAWQFVGVPVIIAVALAPGVVALIALAGREQTPMRENVSSRGPTPR